MFPKAHRFSTIFMIVAVIGSVVGLVIGAMTLSQPKGPDGTDYSAYEARVEIGSDNYQYFNTLAEAIEQVDEEDTIEIINNVSLTEVLSIDKSLIFNSLVVSNITATDEIKIVVSKEGGLNIEDEASVRFNATGVLDFQAEGLRENSLITVSGELTISGGIYSNITTSGDGAVFKVNTGGILTIQSGIFENNHAKKGGVVYNEGIFNLEGETGGTFGNNTAEINGAAIYNKGEINIKSSPNIEDEIYLAENTFIHIAFLDANWLRPLKVTPEINTGEVKIAEKSNEVAGSLTSKFDESILYRFDNEVSQTEIKAHPNNYVVKKEAYWEESENNMFIKAGDLQIIPMSEELHNYDVFELIDNGEAYQIIRASQTYENKELVIPNYYSPTNSSIDAKPVTTIYGTSTSNAAFYDKGLESILLPETITSIGAYAFSNNQLTSITLPNSVTEIGAGALLENYKLVQIRNYSEVELTEKYNNNPEMEIVKSNQFKNELVLSENEKLWFYNIKANNGNVTKRYILGGKSILSGDLDLDNYLEIGKSYEIYTKAFSNNQLTSVIIPNNVVNIGTNAFNGNTNLIEVTMSSSNIVQGFETENSQGHLIANAEVIFIEENLIPIGEYFVDNFQFHSNEEGYKKYVIKEEFTQGLAYQLISNGEEYKVTGIGSATIKNIVIPSVYEGKPVTEIGNQAFREARLTGVTIPSSIRSIGKEAFYYNHLTSVTIPESVTSIGSYAFAYNYKLVQVRNYSGLNINLYAHPVSDQEIKQQASKDEIFKNELILSVDGRVWLYNVKNQSGEITKRYILGINGALSGTLNLSNYMENGEEYEVYPYAFYETQLTSITIGEGVTTIRDHAFSGAATNRKGKLSTINISNSVINIEEYAFAHNELNNLTIPGSVKNIAELAFYNNELTTVVIGSGVEEIGTNAFGKNLDLTTVVIDSLHIAQGLDLQSSQGYLIADATFVYIKEGITPEGEYFDDNFQFYSKEMGYDEYVNNSAFTEGLDYEPISNGQEYRVVGIGNVTSKDIVIPLVYNGKPVTEIGDRAFRKSQLTSVVIPGSVRRIGEEAFYYNNLTNVIIEEGVENIGSFAFQNNQLTKIVVPSSVDGIGIYAFSENQLTEAEIGNGLINEIDSYVFYQNPDLKTVKIDSPYVAKVLEFQDSQGYLISNATTVYVKEDITPSGSYFEDKFNIASTYSGYNEYTINSSFTEGLDYEIVYHPVTNEEEYSVIGLGSATAKNIVIPAIYNDKPVTMVGNYAFKDQNLTSVVIPEGIRSIGDYAFQNNQLTSLVLPNSVRNIWYDAFSYNQLTSVTFGENVVDIGWGAFQNNNLTSVVIPDKVTSIGSNAFYENELTSITIGKHVSTVGAYSFTGNQLIEVSIPSTVRRIEDYAFSNNNKLVRIINHSDVDMTTTRHYTWNQGLEIRQKANVDDPFNNDLFLSQDGKIWYFNLKNSNKEVIKSYILGGNGVLNGNLDLNEYVESGKNYEIFQGAFYKNQLTSVIIPQNITKIEKLAFYGNKLENVIIPNTVTSIGDFAFVWNQLTKIVIPNSVTEIGNQVFSGNFKLVQVTNHSNLNLAVSYFESPTDLEIRQVADGNVNLPFNNELVSSADGRVWLYNIKNPITGNITERYILGGKSYLSGILDLNDYVESGKTYKIYSQAFYGNQLTKVVIPNNVVKIEHSAFSYNQINSLSIGSGITVIESYAFSGNVITSIDIPNTVTTIEEGAFSRNRLNSLVIPNSVTSLGEHAFYNNRLASLTISNNLSSIGNGVFQNNKLTSVTIPNNVKSIGVYAFESNQLSSINFGSGVTKIENFAFMNNNFTSINIGNVITEIGAGAFSWNQLQSVTLGNALTDIGYDAFLYNKISAITIPNYVRNIGNMAFAFNNIATLTIGTRVTNIGEEAFRDNLLTAITFPNSVTSVGRAAFSENKLNRITFGTGLTSIEESVFEDNELTSVTIPSSVTRIEAFAFYNNILTSVTIGNKVASIGEKAFYGNNLATVTFSSGSVLKTIGKEAFKDNQITRITIPSTVTSIEEGAFQNNLIATLAIPNNVESIGASAFSNNKLTSVTFGNSLTTIEEYAFSDNLLTTLNIVRYITNIGEGAFANNNLTTVTFAASSELTIIEKEVFKNNNITSVTFREGLTTIKEGAFANNQLAQITLPSTLIDIEAFAFSDNKFTSIVLPVGITSIRSSVFLNNQLTNVTFLGEVSNIGESAFANNNFAEITISEYVSEISTMAFYQNTNLKTVVIASETIVKGLTSGTSQGYLVAEATVIYIDENISKTEFGNYLKNSFVLATSDREGYRKYIKQN